MIKFQKLTKEQKALRRRILEISHKKKFAHLGSCLSAVDIIAAVYQIKDKNEKFILSAGHAAVALYSILEKHQKLNRDKTETLGVHPERDPSIDIPVSTGSLGQGLPIAVGMALADRGQKIFCLISDGECSEGSIWEALRIASENKLTNLKIIVNANGYGAYSEIHTPSLRERFRAFGYKVITINGHNIAGLRKNLVMKSKIKPIIIFAKTTVDQLSFLKGQDAHYKIMSDDDYLLGLKEMA